MTTKRITLSGIMIALYVVVMYFTQSFAFGAYQIRIATALYAMSYIFPFLILPMGLANFISNTVMGGLGIFDMVGGAIVGMIATTLIYLIRKYKMPLWLIAIPIIAIPSLIVPIWLSVLIKVPYLVLVVNIAIGQIIPAVAGVCLVKSLKNRFV